MTVCVFLQNVPKNLQTRPYSFRTYLQFHDEREKEFSKLFCEDKEKRKMFNE
jgi:hypothetical protein